MRPQKATSAKLLKVREDLTDAARHDLAAALSRWSQSEEHARRIVMALPERPSALDVRDTAARVPVPTTLRAPRANCPRCFGSGWKVSIETHGYTGVQRCECVVAQPELSSMT